MQEYTIDSLTIEELKEIIATGDNSIDNQLRCRKDGIIFLSQEVGNNNIEDIAFRFEIFYRGTNRVGPSAANNKHYIEHIFRSIKKIEEMK